MIAVVDRVVQYPHRYKLTNIENGQVLGTFDLDPVLGTIQAEGTKINKALFDSIEKDIAAKLATEGGDLKNTIITFDEFTGSAEIASGDKASLIIAKIKKRLKDFEANYETKTDSSKKLEEAKAYAAEQASTAKSEAISTAASDATTKANQAESNANSYTDGQVSTINKALEKKADLVNGKVPANQIPTAGVNVEQAEKDGSGNVITTTYETKADASKKLETAKSYADTKKTEAIEAAATDATNKANAAQSAAIAAAAQDATQKANQAESNANNYTNTKIKELDEATYQKIVDCDHEYEITGKTGHEYNLAVPDETTLKLVKIQGKTGRASENLAHLADKSETTEKGITYKIENGTLTLIRGTATSNLFFTVNNSLPTTTTSAPNINKEVTTGRVLLLYEYNDSPVYFPAIIPNLVYGRNDGVNYKQIIRVDTGTTVDNHIIKLMTVQGTYTSETMPNFKPYDNTLVNSKCKLISTNKNLFNDYKERTLEAGTEKWKNWAYDELSSWGLEIGKTYSVYYPKASGSINPQVIPGYNNFRDKVVTFKFAENTILRVGSNNLTAAISFTPEIMLVYGTYTAETMPSFEIREQDTFITNEELGNFDYIDNVTHKKHNGQSEIITIDGSPDENWTKASTSISGHYRFRLEIVSDVSKEAPSNEYMYIINKSNWIDIRAQDTNVNVEALGIAVQGRVVFISNPNFTEIEQLRTWLQTNPVSFVYKLKTPTITDLNLPAGYKVWNGGLQWQEPQGKYLPYVLTKEYAVSQKAQIDLNADMNVEQQSLIDKQKSFTDGIKYNENYVDADKVYTSQGATVDETLLNLDVRLKQLGFKEGAITFRTYNIPNDWNSGVTQNQLKKQGKYVLFNLAAGGPLGSSTIQIDTIITSQGSRTKIGTIPEGFRPKEDTSIYMIVYDTTVRRFTYLTLTIGTNGDITAEGLPKVIANYLSIKNAGWETT